MKNQKGSVLVMTVGFMLVFTLLGFGAMSYSGFQGQGIAMKTSSTQGFWLAEAGVQRAITHLSQGAAGFTLSDSLGQGNYAAVVTPISSVRWTIDSTGTQLPVSKEILVEYGPDIIKGLQSTGPQSINKPENVPSREAYATFSFLNIFGFPITNITGTPTIATHAYTDATYKNNSVVDGITFIDYSTSNASMPNLDGSGLVVIKTNPGKPLTINGSGVFNGIVWIEGELGGLGNTHINGAVFVNCASSLTPVSGNAQIYYDKAAIDAAFMNLNINKFSVVSWQEVH
jgi:hypothetical protein